MAHFFSRPGYARRINRADKSGGSHPLPLSGARRGACPGKSTAPSEVGRIGVATKAPDKQHRGHPLDRDQRFFEDRPAAEIIVGGGYYMK